MPAGDLDDPSSRRYEVDWDERRLVRRPEPGDPSTAVRALALVGAFFGLVWLGGVVENLLNQGFPWTAGALVVAATPLVALLGSLALAPTRLQGLLSRRTRVNLGDAAHVGALVLVAAALSLVFGLGAAVDATFAAESIVVHGESPTDVNTFDEANLVFNILVNVVVFTLPPLAWVAYVGERGTRASLRRLGFRAPAPLHSILVGVGLALAAVVGLAIAVAVAVGLGAPPPTNPRAEAIARALSLPTAILLSLGAAFGEEVFFRGFLQPRLGLVSQAALFSLAHVGYLSILQLAVAFALGYAFGIARERSGGLVAPMVAHFTFNFVQLASFIYGGSALLGIL